VRSFQSLLTHLATLTRNDIRNGTDPHLPTVPTLTTITRPAAGTGTHPDTRPTATLTRHSRRRPGDTARPQHPPAAERPARHQSRNFGLGFRLPCCGR